MSAQALVENRGESVPGTVYLLHFDQRVGGDGHKGAAHYIGWAIHGRLFSRLAQHERGNGDSTPVIRALVQGGGTFQLARTWAGDRFLERRLKNRRNHKYLCPICRGQEEGAPTWQN